ncbi:hypothetical protein EJ110_NYTH06392 [Nymphaea thermarum]|nr:hypothetical protein EJ110_NYTH06392 [Nymphaea thermarum]
MKRGLLPQSQGAGKKNQQQCPQGTIPILRQLTNGHNTLNIPSSYSTNANAVSISEDYREVFPSKFSDSQPRFYTHWQDEDGNWWLQFNQDPIGYWPGSLFPYLSSGANSTEWGGEILNTRPGGSRSTTQMGSGHPWFEGFRSAAYISSMRYVDRDDEKQQLQVVNVDAIVPFVTSEGCNQAAYYGNDDWMHRHLFFGGTHDNSTCS